MKGRKGVSVDNKYLIRGDRRYLVALHDAVGGALRDGPMSFSHNDEEGDEGVTTIVCIKPKRKAGFRRPRAGAK